MCDHEPKEAKGMCKKCYLHAYRQTPEYKEKNRKRQQTPEYKEKDRKRQQTPEYKEADRKRRQTLEYKEAEHKRRRTPEYKENRRTRENARHRNDRHFCVGKRLRQRLNKCIKHKSATTQTLTGCTWEFLVEYLESKFKPGMTWENRSEWHIDHIIPLASFDLTDPEQQRAACHYTNLQPLWASENISKGARCPTLNSN